MPTNGASQPSWQDSIPTELRNRPQWVGRTSEKEPINARTGKRASSTDLTTWASFAEAVSHAERHGLPGVGFVFSSGDAYTGVDLDHAFDEAGALKPWADQIVRAFEGSAYIERSPSGSGLHIIGKGKAPRQGKVKTEDGAVEVYDRERYFTVTGQPYGTPVGTVGDCQGELTKLCSRLWPIEQTTGSTNGERWSTGLTDEQVISKALAGKHGKEFADLYLRGDLTGHSGDHSAADMALVARLAYWTGPSSEQIDRLYRQSKLYRAKWDERRNDGTYGSETIARQLAQQTSYHQPSGRTARDRFTIVTADELLTRPDPQYRIDGVLVEGTMAALIGEPASFKTFIALDMALCIASGLPWAGHRVSQAPVLYVSAEGSAGLSKRLRAWAKVHKMTLPPDFHSITEAVNLLEPAESMALREAIAERGVSYGLIVIDTLARCMVGGDENSAKDMGIAVNALTELAHETGATMLALHHVTKATGSIRGSTALPGALDTTIKAERDGDSLTLACTKQKDADEFEPHYFASQTVELGDEVTSLVLHRISEPAQQQATAQPTGPAHTAAVLAILRELSPTGEEVRQGDWQRACAARDIAKSSFDRAREWLVAHRRVDRREGESRSVFYRIAEPTPFDQMTGMNDQSSEAA